MTEWPPRLAVAQDLPALARLWHQGWTEAHAAHVPAELTRLRTPRSFLDRLGSYGEALRTAGPPGAPLGLAAVREGKLDQMYVAPAARGTGLAHRLLSDAETRLAAQGVREAILYVIPKNLRARRFYRHCGWRDRGLGLAPLETAAGPFEVPVMVMVKPLRGSV